MGAELVCQLVPDGQPSRRQPSQVKLHHAQALFHMPASAWSSPLVLEAPVPLVEAKGGTIPSLTPACATRDSCVQTKDPPCSESPWTVALRTPTDSKVAHC